MWEIVLTVGVVAVQAFLPPSAAAESPSALQCNITQLQRLLRSSKCDLHWDIPNTSLSCRCSTNPNITTAIRLYNTSSETGHLWIRDRTVPNCSSIAPPAPFSCAVCFDQFLHVVCSNLRTENGMVELELEHRPIDTIKCGCPRSLGVGQLMAQNLSALSCRVTSLSDESNRYQLILQPKLDTKSEKPHIDAEETNCTVNCTCLMDEHHPANHKKQDGRRTHPYSSLTLWGLWGSCGHCQSKHQQHKVAGTVSGIIIDQADNQSPDKGQNTVQTPGEATRCLKEGNIQGPIILLSWTILSVHYAGLHFQSTIKKNCRCSRLLASLMRAFLACLTLN